MREADFARAPQRPRGARAATSGAGPRIISDNGPQFIARDFKEFIRVSGMTHVRTSPYYPQSNGKIERWHKSLKTECVRPASPSTLDDARRAVGGFVTQYNSKRLHSSIGYVTPRDKLAGRAAAIHAQRDRKLAAAREARRRRRQSERLSRASQSERTSCVPQQAGRMPCVSQLSERMSSASGSAQMPYASESTQRSCTLSQSRRMSCGLESVRIPCVPESGGPPTYELESPWSSVASASPHPVPGDAEATGRKGRPPAVPEPRPSAPAGGMDEHQEPSSARGAELLNTLDGLSNSR